jgi:hypothetical protein
VIANRDVKLGVAPLQYDVDDPRALGMATCARDLAAHDLADSNRIEIRSHGLRE